MCVCVCVESVAETEILLCVYKVLVQLYFLVLFWPTCQRIMYICMHAAQGTIYIYIVL